MSENQTTPPVIDLTKLSSTELKKLLAEAEKQERIEKETRRKDYESKRNKKVNSMVALARTLNERLVRFKKIAFDEMEALKELANEYGDIRKGSKGGFSLRNEDGTKMVVLRRNVVTEYDERADLALGQIREFLNETIKKKDMQTYRTISVLLEKNKAGDLNPSRVADLLKIKDNYEDERWKKAMELLVESYREREVSYNLEFYQKDEQGKDQMVSLNLSSI